MKDALGDRMKEQYEKRTRTFLPRRTYTIIRLDGKCFGNFTKGMKKPYDEDFMYVMDKTARFLCNEIQGCKFGYVQSDEISLLLTDFDQNETNAWFDGQVQKIVSVVASMATAFFNNFILKMQAEKRYSANCEGNLNHEDLDNQKLAFFDARVFTIPDPIEVENYFVYRQKDAMRNAISMHAQSLYSNKELHGKNQIDMKNMILEKGEDFYHLHAGFQWGRCFTKLVPSGIGAFCLMHYNFLEERINLSLNIPRYE